MESFAFHKIHLKPCPVCKGQLLMQVYLSQEDKPVGNVHCVQQCDFPTRYFCSREKFNEVVEDLNVENT